MQAKRSITLAHQIFVKESKSMPLLGLLLLSLFVNGSIFAAPPVLANPGVVTPRFETTTDSSRQIVVSGESLETRIAFMHAASGLRTSLLNGLRQPAPKYPIARPVLMVLTPGMRHTSPPHLQIIEDPGGIKLQLNLSPQLDPSSILFERTLIHALLVELALRGQKQSNPDFVPTPPRWLVDALRHQFQYPDLFLAIDSLRPILESGQIPSLSKLLLKADTADATSSSLDESVSRCLLTLLMAQPGAQQAITSLFQHPSDEGTALSNIIKQFPSLGSSDADLQRQWTLHLASFGTQRERVILTGPQTLKELNRLLEIDLTDTAGTRSVYAIEQFSDYLRLPGIRSTLTCRSLELVTLLHRGHFYYSEAIKIYADVCSALAEGRTKGQSSELKKAAQLRDEANTRLERIHDYLNWFEAEERRDISPQLQEVYRMWDEMGPPQKNPYVSKALDELEKRLKQESEDADIERALRESSARSKNQR
ncbi:MAG: hypothetical protein WCO60_09400 [Verrucomicrobiota bacterium]